MKVRLIVEDTIYNYCKKNARAKSSFNRFLEIVGEGGKNLSPFIKNQNTENRDLSSRNDWE